MRGSEVSGESVLIMLETSQIHLLCSLCLSISLSRSLSLSLSRSSSFSMHVGRRQKWHRGTTELNGKIRLILLKKGSVCLCITSFLTYFNLVLLCAGMPLLHGIRHVGF